jgi:nucleoside 2-deoxyribosyltransferase
MKTFKRHKPRIYLAGGMENAPDYGVRWRTRVQKWLIKDGWEVHNPCTKETDIFVRRGVKASTFKKLKTRKTLDVYKSIMRDLIEFDLKTIEQCDAVLCYWDEYVSGGTFHELGHAYYTAKIPVIIMAKLPLKKVSGWSLGCMKEIFFSWKDVKTYLAGGKNVNRVTGRSKKRKRYRSKSNTNKVSRTNNVVSKTVEGSSKINLRVVGRTG